MEQEEKKEEIDEEIEVKSVAEKPERIRTPDFSSHYSNGVVIANTQFDIQLIFGHMTFEPNQKFVVNEHTIITSPAHAKSLFELLGHRLKDWETNFGKIELRKKALPSKD